MRLVSDRGYEASSFAGAPWLAGGVDRPGQQIVEEHEAGTEVAIEPSKNDLLGPVGFSIVLRGLGKSSATLDAWANRESERTLLWSGSIPFSADGTAVLPFWTHRLVLTHAVGENGAGVRARFSADGDGKPWEPLGDY